MSTCPFLLLPGASSNTAQMHTHEHTRVCPHTHTQTHAQVAAKLLKRSDEIALGDFRTEINTLRKVHHPNMNQVGLAFLPPLPRVCSSRHSPIQCVAHLSLYAYPCTRQGGVDGEATR